MRATPSARRSPVSRSTRSSSTSEPGYCQQFSGAMALLLRMGGVPARVASGFTSGSFDRSRDEWVVRDVDAHSWVEVYFPGQGWVAFDPTPEVAPPRAQLVDAATDPSATESSGGGGDPGLQAGDRQTDPRIGDVPVPESSPQQRSSPFRGPAAIGAGLVLLVALVVIGRRRRRAAPWAVDDPHLRELVRALHLTGRTPRARADAGDARGAGPARATGGQLRARGSSAALRRRMPGAPHATRAGRSGSRCGGR